MEKFINLRKSKWLLFMLFALLTGVSPAWAQKTVLYSYGFENNSLTTEGWTLGGTSVSGTGIQNTYKRTGSYAFQFKYKSTGTDPSYLISPEFSGIEKEANLEFYYRAYSSGTETFHVGYSTTTADIDAFTFGSEIFHKILLAMVI